MLFFFLLTILARPFAHQFDNRLELTCRFTLQIISMILIDASDAYLSSADWFLIEICVVIVTICTLGVLIIAKVPSRWSQKISILIGIELVQSSNADSTSPSTVQQSPAPISSPSRADVKETSVELSVVSSK